MVRKRLLPHPSSNAIAICVILLIWQFIYLVVLALNNNGKLKRNLK